MRPYFSFTLEGLENRGGRQVYRIAFQQERECPFISVNRKPRSAAQPFSIRYDLAFPDFIDLRERLNGILLIDTNNFQIVKEERKMTLFPDEFDERVTLNENVFEYQQSQFGILTPLSIVHVQHFVNLKSRRSTKRGSVRFDYSGFTKPDVEIRSNTSP